MSARDVLTEYRPHVVEFISELETTDDDTERAAHLRRVSILMRLLRTFYEAFLCEEFQLDVQGFSYKDKRKVSRRLVRAEGDSPSASESEEAIELAARFEELSDLFHGAFDFGYSEDDDDFVSFHREAFPEWLDAVETWLRSTGDENDRALADAMDDLWKRYSSAIDASY